MEVSQDNSDSDEDTPSARIKGRNKERVNYFDEETSHESDYESIEEDEDEQKEQIESVLDYRKGKKGATGDCTMHFTIQAQGDPNIKLKTEETEDQYLIKWTGLAHYKNTWESLDTLNNRPNKKPLKSLRKVLNYKDKVSGTEVESEELQELSRNLLKTYLEPERIFAEKRNLGTDRRQSYYVKWKNLSYSQSTWEDSETIESFYRSDLEKYLATKKSNAMPVNYNQIVLSIRKGWQSMKEQPDYIGSGTLKLRDYQLDGINFLLHAWHKRHSVILADEMGLGKTVQSIAFLQYLHHNYGFKGPMLVSAPLSTLSAWKKEFETWAPEMNAVVYIGDKTSREIIRQYECLDQTGELDFCVLLTSYEMVGKDQDFIGSISWSNIVIDEAHRLKNQNSLLYKVLSKIDAHHVLLLTGTPLQNSLKELWCLLNFIKVPDLDTWDEFEINYGSKKDRELGYVKLHKLLKPFIIRRLKKDVEKSLPPKVEKILRVDMTVAQKSVYKTVLGRNFEVLCKGKNQVSLLNLMMQLRKACNHAHLILEPDEIAQDEEERCKQLVYGSGKLVLLDKLLTRFREKGDRVLIFSQMVKMLNIIEEYLLLRRYQFQRLDGSLSAEERKQSIATFNNAKSSDFCFLLSTKAGGLGINLQTANVVIMFDSDFNPQNDLQAIARAHRIGQKGEVKIYRLVASNSVDEKIIQRAKNKMILDHLVIQRMDTTGQSLIGGGSSVSLHADGVQLSKEELNIILKFGAEELFNSEEETEKEGEVDIDTILKQVEVNEKNDTEGGSNEFLRTFKCTTLTFEETEKNEEMAGAEALDWNAIIPIEMRPKKCNDTSKIESLNRKQRTNRLQNKSIKDINRNEESEKSSEMSNTPPIKREQSPLHTTWINQDILDEMLIKSENIMEDSLSSPEILPGSQQTHSTGNSDGSVDKTLHQGQTETFLDIQHQNTSIANEFKDSNDCITSSISSPVLHGQVIQMIETGTERGWSNQEILLEHSQNHRMEKSAPLTVSPVGKSQRSTMSVSSVPAAHHVLSSREMTIIAQQTMHHAHNKRNHEKHKENFKRPEADEHGETNARSDSDLRNDCIKVIPQEEDVGGVKSLRERQDKMPLFPGKYSAALDINQDRIPRMQHPLSPSRQMPMGKSLSSGEMETLVDIQDLKFNDSNDCTTSHCSSPVFHGFPSSPHTSLNRNLDLYEDILTTLNFSDGEDDDLIVIEDEEESTPSITKETTKPEELIKLCEYPVGHQGPVIVTIKDYATLDSETFVNDIIIDFYIRYLQHNVLSVADQSKTHIFSTMFYKRLMQSPKKASNKIADFEKDVTITEDERRHFRVANWTKNVDIFHKKMVIVPICEDSHWFLLVATNLDSVNFTAEPKGRTQGSSCIIVLDSMGYEQAAAVENLRSYLTCEWKKRNSPREGPVQDLKISSKEMPVFHPNKPEQVNGVDCGVFLLHYLEKIFLDVINFLSPKRDISSWFTLSEIGQKRAEIAQLLKRLDKEQNGLRNISYPNIKLGQ